MPAHPLLCHCFSSALQGVLVANGASALRALAGGAPAAAAVAAFVQHCRGRMAALHQPVTLMEGEGLVELQGLLYAITAIGCEVRQCITRLHATHD